MSTSVLTWSKLIRGTKLQNEQYLRDDFIFYFVREPKSRLIET